MRVSKLRGVVSLFSQQSAGDRPTETFLRLEALERRDLMSANAMPEVQPLAVAGSAPYTPAEIRAAYGFNGITFNNGKVAGNGAGETIAIVDAYGDSRIASDLATFDAMFGLAPANLKVVNETGGANLPTATNSSWAMETALDVEWAHAIAPGATILLVQATTSGLGDLLTAVNTARNAAGVSVVSMSWGTGEFLGETSFDSYFTTPAGHIGVTFVGASGDAGAPSLWPSLSSNVLAVGGTTLSITSAGGYINETAWNESGGGYSQYESEPSYQRGVQTTGVRTGPDVSYDANPSTGFYVYDTLSASGWYDVGGTSAGTPQWAALIAIADQGRAATGQASLNGVNSQIYNLPATDFHDVTAGSNGYAAHAGYDLDTGRGSPIANLVIQGLVGNVVVPPPAPAVPKPAASQPGVISIRGFEAGLYNSMDDVFAISEDGTSTDVSTNAAMLQVYQQVGARPTLAPETPAHDNVDVGASVKELIFRSSSISLSLNDRNGLSLSNKPSVTPPQTTPATEHSAHGARDAGKAVESGATSFDAILFGAGAAEEGIDQANPPSVKAAELLPADLEAVWSTSIFGADPENAAVPAAATPTRDPNPDSQASALLSVVAGLAIGGSQLALESRLEASKNHAPRRRQTAPLARQ